MTVIKEISCPYCFAGPKRGVCDMVSQIRNQAEAGNLSLEDWKSFIERMRDDVLPFCEFPDQLNEALDNTEFSPPEN